MAELKTQVTSQSVTDFLKTVEPQVRQADSLKLLKIFKDATGLKPKMWGTSIVGFGSFHYESKRSAQKGDWPLIGFSPRKQNLTVYIMPGFKEYDSLLKGLGKVKTSSGSCLYIKKLADIDTQTLTTLIKRAFADAKKKYQV